MVSWWSETNLVSITILGLTLNIAVIDLILNQGSSPLGYVFFNLVKSDTFQWRVLKLRLFRDSICFVFQNWDCKFSKVMRLRLQFWIFRDWDLTKIIETEDFLRLSLISYQDNSTNNTVSKLTITSHTCTLIRDLRDQFLRFETETEQVQSQQGRPRLLFTNIRDWDQENVYFRDRDRDQENGRDRDREFRWSLVDSMFFHIISKWLVTLYQ